MNIRKAASNKWVEIASKIVKRYQSDIDIDVGMITAELNAPRAMILNAYENGTNAFVLLQPDSDAWPTVGKKERYLFGMVDRKEMLDSMVEGMKCSLKLHPENWYEIPAGSDKVQKTTHKGTLETINRWRDETLNHWSKQV